MIAFLNTSVTGFLAAFLILGTATLPYALRYGRRWMAASGGMYGGMQVHYRIGYLILALVIAHMFVSMQAGMARGMSLVGLSFASFALLLVVIQVLLGRALRKCGPQRSTFRRVHFGIMVGILVFSALHMALNSVLLRNLLSA